MEKYAALFTIILVVLYGTYNATRTHHTPSTKPKNTPYTQHTKDHPASHAAEELAKLDTAEYAYDYIRSVIKHGSEGLGFPGGVMEGGYIGEADAPGVACYVLHLSGKVCPAGTQKEDAHLFFSSNCAGCHGNDGRGLGGKYPDLTRPTLLGIEKRREQLH